MIHAPLARHIRNHVAGNRDGSGGRPRRRNQRGHAETDLDHIEKNARILKAKFSEIFN
jgi:hypothetical protein